MEEEGISFNVAKGIFYNPEMQFCRSFCSLAVGAIEDKMRVCDGFSASGIRGIRYAKENKNIVKTIFMDIDRKAISCVKKNAKRNKVKAEFRHGNISKMVFETIAEFVEIDPFGSPAPYLYDALRMFNPLKTGYLSATATDTAVLCGAKLKACVKNYHSKPLNNEFTHEVGLRILMKKIVEVAAEFNFGVTPLVSMSDRHYLKVILKLERSADAAYESMRKLGYIEFCKSCGFRRAVEFPGKTCKNCARHNTRNSKLATGNRQLDYAGLLWLGELHDGAFLDKMIKLNKKRDYAHKEEIEKTLNTMKGEITMPPYYYNIHETCGRIKSDVIKTNDMVAALRKMGFKAGKTHFSDISVKTNAEIRDIERALTAWDRIFKR